MVTVCLQEGKVEEEGSPTVDFVSGDWGFGNRDEGNLSWKVGHKPELGFSVGPPINLGSNKAN